MNKKQIEDFVEEYLEDADLEDLLEEFDISPSDAFWELYQNGLIDDDLLNGLRPVLTEVDD
jgi:hypothetical protein